MQNENASAATIVRRLETLERQNRRLRVAVATLALGVGVVLLTAASPSTPDSVTARKFVLIDDDGHQRGVLETTSGNPDLVFEGTVGQRAVFGISATGPARFILSGKEAEENIEASVLQGSGLAHLSVQGAKDNFVNIQAVSNDVSVLADASDGRGIELTAGFPGPKEGAALTLYDDAKPRLTLGVASLTNEKTGGTTKSPVSTITAFDKNGNVLGQWP